MAAVGLVTILQCSLAPARRLSVPRMSYVPVNCAASANSTTVEFTQRELINEEDFWVV